jgi:hypothetical protein
MAGNIPMDYEFVELYFWIPYALILLWFLYTATKDSEKKDK